LDRTSLETFYRDYGACLNRRDWAALGRFVAADAEHDGRPLGLDGCRAMLAQDPEALPDPRFAIELRRTDPHGSPAGAASTARRTGRFRDCRSTAGGSCLPRTSSTSSRAAARIAQVWSVIDKAAIERQLEADAAAERR